MNRPLGILLALAIASCALLTATPGAAVSPKGR